MSIVHRGPRPLGQFDPDLVDLLVERTRALGVEMHLGTSVTRVAPRGQGRFDVHLEGASDASVIQTDLVVHGAGRVPDIDDLDCAAGEVAFGPDGIQVDAHLRSPSNPRVWAAGDCAATGAPPLTPMAAEEGARLADNLLRDAGRTADVALVPSAVFTIPPLARVGLLASEAEQAGRPVRTTHEHTASWLSSRRLQQPASAFKILIDEATDQIVGAHLLGPGADEVANVFAVAMQAGLSATALKRTRLVYPTSGSDIKYML